MFILHEHNEEDSKEINQILVEENIEDLSDEGLVYTIIEDDNICGIAKAEIINEDWTLKYLVIKKASRGENLGDALLRALLSKLDNQGIKKILYKEANSYLAKKGFELNKNNRLELHIPDIFKKGCNSCGGCNDL
ncbi:GNAT family N-acetyltransferase [Tissierella sp.]|uniref:GNAT family N-acetyltransferase n=1 Tax=Tissierella sp. TaxID=41274 RepID=UPI0028579B53|nr:GNAT family N-acetyltransferase [Tissierella sp.]MDR7856174.1 GNAT family N-acetyltransferase [Tissierella sp.]